MSKSISACIYMYVGSLVSMAPPFTLSFSQFRACGVRHPQADVEAGEFPITIWALAGTISWHGY